jgi:DNA-binding MarR family transcriptional regulator
VARRASPLQRELKQNRPFRSAGHEAVIDLFRTTDVLRRRFEAVLGPWGITGQQYNVLRILRGAGAAGIPTLDIAERLVEQTPGITRLLDRVEKKGWVRRERCREDRRQVLCYSTPAGLRLLADLDPVVDRAELDAVAGLTGLERKELIRLLDALRAGLG